MLSQKMKNKLLFFLGLLIFYLLLLFSPNKPVYFFAYFVTSFFFYLSCKNIRSSLLYALILSLFSDINLAGSLFILEPVWLNFGSGFVISPMTLLISILMFLSFTKNDHSIRSADILLFLFFAWNIFSSFFFSFDNNVIFTLISLAEIILCYLLLRLHISEKNIGTVSYLLISMVIFQSLLGAVQLLLGKPAGILPEIATVVNPLGISAVEDPNLFRITGTFGHPNFFAAFLLGLLPFVLLWKPNNYLFNIFKILALLTLFFTYSRAAWGIFILLFLAFIIMNKNVIRLIQNCFKYKTIIIISAFLIMAGILFPLVISRMEPVKQAFTNFSMFDMRSKLFQEGLKLTSWYPITGVGLNRSLGFYAEDPITDIFFFVRPSGFYRIHNLFLEIAAEIGIPGGIFFMLFLLSIILTYFKEKPNAIKQAAFYGLLGLIGISMFNPFFHTSSFRWFFLLSAIILA